MPTTGRNDVLEIRLLGEMKVLRDGDALELPASRKTRALLAYLAVTGRPHARSWLCELLWDLPDDPRGALRWSLSKLRPLVNDRDDERIVADRETVCLQTDDTDIDVVRIRRQVESGIEALSVTDLETTAASGRGEFLRGLESSLPDPFCAWCTAMREDLRSWRSHILTELIERLEERPDRVLPYARELVELDPLDETRVARLVRILHALGRRKEAAQQYETAVARLDDAGITPSLVLRAAKNPAGNPASSRASSEREGPPLAPAGRDGPPEPAIRQDIRYCTAADGVRIAYATVGTGSPLVKAANWLSHLEYDWESPVWRHLYRELAREHALIRYDERGNGLSDWNVEGISFEAFVRDLETVVDSAGIEQFPLLGISQGCSVGIAYAVRHPERVSRLVLVGGYLCGWRARGVPEEIEYREALQVMIRQGWGRDTPALRQYFTALFIPDATPEQVSWFHELQRRTTSAENAFRLTGEWSRIDVRALAARVSVPTLVLHSRGDASVPFSAGQEIAKTIPGARFVPLESNCHLVLEHEPAWIRYVDELRRFLQ